MWITLCVFLSRFLQQRGWRNDEINARIERIEAASSGVEEDEGLYATYAMLHTYRKEWVGGGQGQAYIVGGA